MDAIITNASATQSTGAEDKAAPSSSGELQAQPNAASQTQQPNRPSSPHHVTVHDIASIFNFQPVASTSAPNGSASDAAPKSKQSRKTQHKQARKEWEAALAAMAPGTAANGDADAAAGTAQQERAEPPLAPMLQLTPQQQQIMQQHKAMKAADRAQPQQSAERFAPPPKLTPQQQLMLLLQPQHKVMQAAVETQQQQQQKKQLPKHHQPEEEGESSPTRPIITNPEHGFGDGPPGARRPPPSCRRSQQKQKRREKEQQEGGQQKQAKSSKAAKPPKPPEPPKDPVAEAFKHFGPLVEAELKEEWYQVNERQRKWPLERLQREGVVLMGLMAKKGKVLFGRPITTLELPDMELPWHRFTSGDLVRLTRLDYDNQGPPVIEASVLDGGRWSVRVVCEMWLPAGPWRMDMGAKALTYERMQAALQAMAIDPEHADEKKREGPPGTPLRGLLLWPNLAGAARPAPGLLPPAAMQWADRVSEGGRWAEDEARRLQLNVSQLAGISKSFQCKISLIQGPPGTGKTTTTVQMLRLLTREFNCPFRIIACAPSNVAVDNLLEGLVDAGVRALRVGQPVKVRESLRGQSVDAFIERHPLGLEVEETRAFARALTARMPHMRGKDKGIAMRDVVAAQKVATELRTKMMADILDTVQVVCSTCGSAASDALEGVCFPFVVMDEGSQCCEPESLIPIVKGCRQVVLVGDQNQLPPVVISDKAAHGGLDISLFERLMASGAPSSLLNVQYRMHPLLSHFPNQRFYGGRLLDGVQPRQRPAPDFPFPVQGRPIVLLDVQDGMEQLANSGSKCNLKEAEVVTDVVGHLITSGELAGALGVVSPYQAQVHLISRRLRPLMEYLAPLAQAQQGGWLQLDTDEDGGGSFAESVLEVKSVDGYQGREKEIVVLSTVRANEEGKMGFLDDWRRLNVALTRARRALIVIGHAKTLAATDPHWRAYVSWLEERGCVVNATDWRRALIPGPVAAANVVPEVAVPGRVHERRRGGKKGGSGGGKGRAAGWRQLEQERQQEQQWQQQQQRPRPAPGVVIGGA